MKTRIAFIILLFIVSLTLHASNAVDIFIENYIIKQKANGQLNIKTNIFEGMLREYPSGINLRHNNNILVYVPKNYIEILEDYSFKNVCNKTYDIIDNTNKKARVYINITNNTKNALFNTIEESLYLRYKMSISSTWNKGTKHIYIKDANFVFNFSGGDLATYCINNLYVRISDQRNIDVKHKDKYSRLNLKDMENIARKINMIFQKEEINKTKIVREDKIRLKVLSYNEKSVNIEWLIRDLNLDCWIRIESDDGELSILGKGKVLLENIPEAGTMVHCYAISPDGTKWYKNSIKIEPKEK